VMVVLEAASPQVPELEAEARVSVVHVFEGDTVVQTGHDHIFVDVLDRTFRVSATAFFQANTSMAGRMVQHVLARLPSTCGALIDAFCGVGLFSAFLAPRCQRLIGIESSTAACEDFAHNLDEFDHVELYEDAVERVLPTLDLRPDAILLDPPRAGLDRKALDAVLRLAPPTLIYVSCDPPTLARDAARLIQGGYTVEQIRPFDMFPQTYHIESIAVFTR